MAGASGLALAGSPFLPWYLGSTGIVCVVGPCPGFELVSGFAAAPRRGIALVALGALAVVFALLAELRRVPRLRAAAGGAALLGGAAAIVLALQAFVSPPATVTEQAGGPLAVGRMPGLLLALVAAAGTFSGGWLWLRTDPLSARVAGALASFDLGRILVALGSAGVVGSLWLPWFLAPPGGEIVQRFDSSRSPLVPYSGWQAFAVSDVFLVMLAAGALLGVLAASRSTASGLGLVAPAAGLSAAIGAVLSLITPALLLFVDEPDRVVRAYGADVGVTAALAVLVGGLAADLAGVGRRLRAAERD